MAAEQQQSAGKLLDGVFAINKPQGISSAQVLRNLQTHFDPSKLFAATIAAEAQRLEQASRNQASWRRKKQQRKLSQVKMGHGGTLDPLATGVLITGVGGGTKSLQNFLGCTKSYEATVLFGTATDTYDILGRVVERRAFEHITKQQVLDKLAEFRSIKVQRPPIYSALRHEGKRFYEYARQGSELPIEIPERPIEVTELEMVEWYEPGQHGWEWPKEELQPKMAEVEQSDAAAPASAKQVEVDADGQTTPTPKRGRDEDDESESDEPATKRHQPDDQTEAEELEREEEPLMSGALPSSATPQPQETTTNPKPAACKIRMTVSSGFYVRSLCHDLGHALGSAALMATLVRTRQQNFELGKNVFEYSELDKGEEVWGPQVERLLLDWRAKPDSETGASSPPRYEKATKASNGSGGHARSQLRRSPHRRGTEGHERRRNSSSDES